MRLEEFDYELPAGAIAQRPAAERDGARMLELRRSDGTVRHATVAELPQRLAAGDLLVVNDTRVRPARLTGRKPSGGRVELLLVRPDESTATDAGDGEPWRALLAVSRPPRPGTTLELDGGLEADVVERLDDGWRVRIRAPAGEAVAELVARHGRMPLPPYVRRDPSAAEAAENDTLDRERYQTIFAERAGAVAAPTAGLHFTPRLVAAAERAGARVARVTLHVGPGTFLPVRVDDVAAHRMHAEWCELPPATAAAIAATREAGGRVIAVGTTVVRTLEWRARDDGRVEPGAGWCELFLRPGSHFRVVDGLLTNFHLPRSTLLMLVAAFAGLEPTLAAYREAIAAGYRFYSYGDAMLILDRRASP